MGCAIRGRSERAGEVMQVSATAMNASSWRRVTAIFESYLYANFILLYK